MTFNGVMQEADLGMFSMFGRTGAPQKGGPTKAHPSHSLRYQVGLRYNDLTRYYGT